MKFYRIVISLFFLGFVNYTFAISLRINKSHGDSLPLNSTVVHDILPNGFTYYIKPVPEAPNITIYLWVKAGGANQLKGESLAAHLIEHLPHNGTKNFPGGFIEYHPAFKPYGVKSEAGTGYYRTEYQLSISDDNLNQELLDSLLLWFRDISDLDISPSDVRKEANILKQEFKRVTRKPSSSYFFAEYKRRSIVFPCLNEVLNDFSDFFDNISSEGVTKFYQKWYRPDLMGLAVIGNIKKTEIIERKVRNTFSDIPLPSSPLPINICTESYLNSSSNFGIVEIKWEGNVIPEDKRPLEVFLNYRIKDSNLKKGYGKDKIQADLLQESLQNLLKYRLNHDEIAASFIQSNWLDKGLPYYEIHFKEGKNKEKQRIQRITQLLSSIKNKGFTSEEWIKVRNSLIEQLESKDTTSGRYWYYQIEQHFVLGRAFPDNKEDFLKQILMSLTIEDINRYVKNNMGIIPDDITMVAPSGHKAFSYSEKEVREWIQNVLSKPIDDYKPDAKKANFEEKKVTPTIMSRQQAEQLKPVSIERKAFDSITKSEIITLQNGIKLILNGEESKTNTKGYISIHGYRHGGADLFKESSYYSALNAPSLVHYAGIGNMSNEELGQNLFRVGRQKQEITYINNNTSGIKITGREISAEEIMQLIYLYISQPREITMEAEQNWIEQSNFNYFDSYVPVSYRDFIEAQKDFLGDRIKRGTVYPSIFSTKRFYGIGKTDKKKSYDIYNQLFGHAAEFTFIINGVYSKKAILPLLQKYLGNLPNKNKIVKQMGRIQRLVPSGPVYKEFFLEDLNPGYKMYGPQYELVYRCKVDDMNDWWKDNERLKMISEFISSRVDQLRFKNRFALYDIYVYSIFNPALKVCELRINFDTEAEELEGLRKECENIIQELIDKPIGKKEFKIVCKNDIYPRYITEKSEQLSDDEIFDYYRYNIPLFDKRERNRFIHSLTPENMQETARKYFVKENKYEFVLKNNK
ncbi:M16 family metallopeptidase [Sinomicrobium soli]|uniref:M16 family metallopeptidase n=1 Tax=Sinomicrobium sp. N-1-3-6 TaxID=2219864 RepID=UPI000DCC2D18|nr:insulinase family protein [Sinomicrobium sp. N-1-3-6]RAV27715.1 hypothetical protein DN748_16980 [Sinomicrobium sp. N-1-3-6]